MKFYHRDTEDAESKTKKKICGIDRCMPYFAAHTFSRVPMRLIGEMLAQPLFAI